MPTLFRRPRPAADTATRRSRKLLPVGLLALGVLLGGCNLPSFWAFKGATTQGHDAYLLYAGTFIAAIVVGAITYVLIMWAVVRYRRRSDAMPRQFQYHIPLEIFYTVVPIIIVLVLFGFTVVTENKVDAVSPDPALTVDVTAFQWGWKFDYVAQHRYVMGIRTEDPDPVGLDGQTCPASAHTPNDCLGPGLVLPVGKTVEISLVSNDVIHSFLVPEFDFSRMALPGVDNRFDFNVTKAGIYRAQCNNICGLYHAQMFFHVVALPPAQFEAWVHGPQTLPENQAPGIPSASQSATAAVPPSYPTASASTGTTATGTTSTGTTATGTTATGTTGSSSAASTPAATSTTGASSPSTKVGASS